MFGDILSGEDERDFSDGEKRESNNKKAKVLLKMTIIKNIKEIRTMMREEMEDIFKK